MEIANDGLKGAFETTSLPVFWIQLVAENPMIGTAAIKTPLPFATSYLCEAGFFCSDSNQKKNSEADWT